MKTQSIILSMFAMFGLCYQAGAEKILIINDETGQMIEYDESHRLTTQTERDAYENPEKKVPVSVIFGLERSCNSFRDFFFGTFVSETKSIKVKDSKRVNLEPSVKRGQPVFLWHLPLLGAGILSMIFDFLFREKHYFWAIYAGVFALASVPVFTTQSMLEQEVSLLSSLFYSLFTLLPGFFLSVSAFIAFLFQKRTFGYWIFSVLFVALSVIAMLVD